MKKLSSEIHFTQWEMPIAHTILLLKLQSLHTIYDCPRIELSEAVKSIYLVLPNKWYYVLVEIKTITRKKWLYAIAFRIQPSLRRDVKVYFLDWV